MTPPNDARAQREALVQLAHLVARTNLHLAGYAGYEPIQLASQRATQASDIARNLSSLDATGHETAGSGAGEAGQREGVHESGAGSTPAHVGQSSPAPSSPPPVVGTDGLAWPETMDGMAWAIEFNRRFPSVSVDDALGWMCNAIMRGYDTAMNKCRPESAPSSPPDARRWLLIVDGAGVAHDVCEGFEEVAAERDRRSVERKLCEQCTIVPVVPVVPATALDAMTRERDEAEQRAAKIMKYSVEVADERDAATRALRDARRLTPEKLEAATVATRDSRVSYRKDIEVARAALLAAGLQEVDNG